MILAYHYSYQCRANIPLTHVENDVVVSTWGCAVAESVLLFCFDASVIGFITTITTTIAAVVARVFLKNKINDLFECRCVFGH